MELLTCRCGEDPYTAEKEEKGNVNDKVQKKVVVVMMRVMMMMVVVVLVVVVAGAAKHEKGDVDCKLY